MKGAIYHLLGRGNARQRMFTSERDQCEFVKLLEARNVAMAMVWEKCALSLREIGQLFGGIDYSAVAQRIRRINKATPPG